MRLELVETQRYAVLSQRATRQRWFGRSVAAFTVNSPRVDYGDAADPCIVGPLKWPARSGIEERRQQCPLFVCVGAGAGLEASYAERAAERLGELVAVGVVA